MADLYTLYNVYVDTLQDLIESAVQGDTRRVPLLLSQIEEIVISAEDAGMRPRSITAMNDAYEFTRQAIRQLVKLQIDIKRMA